MPIGKAHNGMLQATTVRGAKQTHVVSPEISTEMYCRQFAFAQHMLNRGDQCLGDEGDVDFTALAQSIRFA